MTCRSSAGSRPEVGSSRISSDGPVSSSSATEARLRWPPESLSTRVSACLVRLEFLEHLGDDLGAIGFAGVGRQPQLGGVAQRLVDRQLAVHDVVLRDHPDPAAQRRVLGVDVVAFEGDRAGAGAGVSGDQPRQRGLARAGPADDRGQRAGPGGQRDVVQQLPCRRSLKLTPSHLQAAGAGRGFGAADQVAAGEDQVDVADRDHVALVEHRRSDPDAVDEGAVDAVRVADLGAERRSEPEYA